MSEREMAELTNGKIPATPEDLFQRLSDLRIRHHTVRHPPVYTVEEAKALRTDSSGAHTKNLFLRNKKGRMWLLVCEQERSVDLKDLARRLGAGRLSLGSPRRLMDYLGVIPGAVTPFAVINDPSGQVRVVLERVLLDFEELNLHPLDNAMTTRLATRDLMRFLEHEGHSPEIVDLG